MEVSEFIAGAMLLLLAALSAVELWRRTEVRRRLFMEDEELLEDEDAPLGERSRLGAWLLRAGVRDPRGPLRFGAGMVAACFIGGALGLFLLRAPWVPAAAGQLFALPVVGSGAAVLLGLVPWGVGSSVAAAPMLWVRRRRRARVASIEHDLPLCLETLATLAEAGSGFDASIAQLLEAQPSERPLHEELRRYRLEMQTGAGRARCLERMGERMGIAQVSDLVRSLTHAEETGAGIAAILRPQAEDLRQQRRERALARAEALPEKLVLPLLVGFLPGLMVWTLGPAFHQLFGMLDAALR